MLVPHRRAPKLALRPASFSPALSDGQQQVQQPQQLQQDLHPREHGFHMGRPKSYLKKVGETSAKGASMSPNGGGTGATVRYSIRVATRSKIYSSSAFSM